MKRSHVPTIDARYWTAIALASVFGTNLGDLYAHESGLGLIGGLPVLIILFGAVYLMERFDRAAHDLYYWLCIIIMRTGATNIADYLAGRRGLNIDRLSLTLALGVLLAALAFWAARAERASRTDASPKSLPQTDVPYWSAMLTAGVFGTVLGDYLQKLIGSGMAAAGLSLLLVGALLTYRRGVGAPAYTYWLVIGVARTTGTAIGDWLADSKVLNLGLPIATLLTGLAFGSVLMLWPRRRVLEAARV